MSKQLLESIKRGLKEVEAHRSGKAELPAKKVRIKAPDVKKIRSRTGMTQEIFASAFGWSLDTVRSWEQGRRIPDHSARVMLALIAENPGFVMDTLKHETFLDAAE